MKRELQGHNLELFCLLYSKWILFSFQPLSLDLTKDYIQTHLQAQNCALFGAEVFRNIMKCDRFLNWNLETVLVMARWIPCHVRSQSALFYILLYRRTWETLNFLNRQYFLIVSEQIYRDLLLSVTLFETLGLKMGDSVCLFITQVPRARMSTTDSGDSDSLLLRAVPLREKTCRVESGVTFFQDAQFPQLTFW